MFKRILLDAFFYLAVPLITWNLFREDLGDYLTILMGMLPAVIYTIAMAILKKEWNVTGIFFLSIISMNFIFNLLSKSAEQELWNGVYMNIISIVFYLITIFIKKPIGMYFFIDYAFAKGIPREKSKVLYRKPKNYPYFVKLTILLTLREVVLVTVLSYIIIEKGVDGFNTFQATNSVLGYIFMGLTVLYVIYIAKNLEK